jgi:ferredoxin
MLMEILVNRDKCKVPMACKKCLQICPQCVFRLHPTHIKKFEEIPLEHWELKISFPDLCAGCMECVKVCPEQALRVKPAKEYAKIEHGTGARC